MIRKIFFQPERCLSCLSCVLACQMNFLGVRDIGKIPKDREPFSRISASSAHGTPWMWTCRHCRLAPCVEACVSGSLRNEEGRPGVVHHPETCVGCGSCLLACPYGAIQYDRKEERMIKCNLCPEEDVPPCVSACRSKALVYREPRLLAWDKRKRVAQEFRRVREAE